MSTMSADNSSTTVVAEAPMSGMSTESTSNATLSNNSTTSVLTGSTQQRPDSGGDVTGTVIAVIITLVAAGALLTLSYFYLKKRGYFSKLSCLQYTRARRSSISSRHALEDHEDIEPAEHPRARGEAEDMFTIEDNDVGHPGEPTENREEYFYDEVFGQSQFEDETTNQTLRQLYSASGDDTMHDDDEMLDYDFETLGIKMDDGRHESSRQNPK
ncbi:unnamed protein product [Lymnaea stagnalis]|uniref:Uncharacterized protein n=1 Tax=Lymnaea stagnalis TaxID=6523 RepID=A0AAV2IEG4_LYMST